MNKSHTVLGIATAIAVATIRAKGHPEEGRALAHELSVIGKDVLAGFVETDKFFESLGQVVDDEVAAGRMVAQPGFPKLTGNAQADGKAIIDWINTTGPEGSDDLDEARDAQEALNQDAQVTELLNALFGAKPERVSVGGCSAVEPRSARGSEKGRKLVPGCAIGGCSIYADEQ